MSFKLSICIPTYNRPGQLPNCLNSICIAKANSNLDFDVCISDNGDTDCAGDGATPTKRPTTTAFDCTTKFRNKKKKCKLLCFFWLG